MEGPPPFPNIFYGLFVKWIRFMKPMDLGNVTLGVSGCFSFGCSYSSMIIFHPNSVNGDQVAVSKKADQKVRSDAAELEPPVCAPLLVSAI